MNIHFFFLIFNLLCICKQRNGWDLSNEHVSLYGFCFLEYFQSPEVRSPTQYGRLFIEWHGVPC